MKIHLTRARAETPGCENVMHFNNAGSSLMPQVVLNSMVDYLRLEAMIGGYEAAGKTESLETVYDRIAELLNCHRDEVALIENATRAWDMAFYGVRFQPGDRILTDQAAYASSYIAFLQAQQRFGVEITAVSNDPHGQISIEALRNQLDDRVKLIAITHMPTNGGLVNPAAEVGKVAREAGVLYLLDACQTAGQLPLDVEAIGCDMLSATGRKFLRGPRGTGFLYVRQAILDQLEPPFLDLHAAKWTARDNYELLPNAQRFENWERNFAGIVGLETAVSYALNWGLDNIWQRVQNLGGQLRQQLNAIPGVTTHDLGAVKGGIVTFTVDGVDATYIKEKLAAQKINVTTSSVFSTRLDMEARKLDMLVRASVHYYNSQAEIDRFCQAIEALV
ncbi:MAG: aminotransferase class V-fold PLP-dependent enzyme [Anaerolineales bacterium]|nr:aminotransferase class V-fold PLP-dependent enzyme [Anaerolineales bacterium]